MGPLVGYEENKCREYSHWDHIHNILFSLKLTNGDNKAERCTLLGQKCLSRTNILAYLAQWGVMKKKSATNIATWAIFTTLFYLQLANGPIELECRITQGLKDVPGASTIAYWVQCYVT
jgi:hypothetical protein